MNQTTQDTESRIPWIKIFKPFLGATQILATIAVILAPSPIRWYALGFIVVTAIPTGIQLGRQVYDAYLSPQNEDEEWLQK